ncbi:MAG: YgjV family protein [Candidatus Gracilibacteria bacterium]|nr:YgjV family protein [Candidatus Gracilibacteria bacterium]
MNEIIKYIINSYQINPIGQIVGFIGFILSIIASQNKCDKRMKNLNGVSLLFWVIHYFLIGLYPAVASDLIGAIRNFLSVKYKGNNKIILLIISTYIIFLIITYNNIYSFLPIISGIIVTFTFFKLGGIKMRLILIGCSIMWIVYNIIGKSLGGITIELFLITSNIITIYRLYKDK